MHTEETVSEFSGWKNNVLVSVCVSLVDDTHPGGAHVMLTFCASTRKCSNYMTGFFFNFLSVVCVGEGVAPRVRVRLC